MRWLARFASIAGSLGLFILTPQVAEAGHPSCRVLFVPGAYSTGTLGAWLFLRPEEYFADYQKYFENRGCEVKRAEFPPDSTIESRALILKDQAERFRKGEDLILIAHSQGGLDARYALKSAGMKGVRALLSIGTPHHGTAVASWVVQSREEGSLIYWLLRIFAGYDLRALSFAGEMTPEFLEKHQSRFAPIEGVRYGSARAVCETGCHLALRWVSRWTKLGAGDGLVSDESQRFGEDLGKYDLDHLSAVNQDSNKAAERQRLIQKISEFLPK